MTPKHSAKMIRIVTWGFIAFAFIWGLAPYGLVSAPAQMLLDLLDWPFGDGAALTRSEMWLSSIGAGLVVALCILLLGIVAPAVERGDKRVARITAWAFIGWYIIDGAGSYASGVGSNVFFNTLLFVPIMIPLLTLRAARGEAQRP